MSDGVVVNSPHKPPTPPPSAQPSQKPVTRKQQEIDVELNASGRKEVGENALSQALSDLNKLVSNRGLNVSKMLDNMGSVKSVHINDDKGNKIAEMPPAAAIAIADKAKEQNIGWLIDALA